MFRIKIYLQEVPPPCVEHNAIFTILHFLTDQRFLSPEVSYVRCRLFINNDQAKTLVKSIRCTKTQEQMDQVYFVEVHLR